MNAKLSQSVFCVFIVLTQYIVACGANAPELTPTATNTLSPTFTPTITLTPTQTPIPTATPNVVATQQYEGFFSWVEKFSNDGVIPSVNGEYYSLDDYSESFAKQAYYTWVTYDGLSSTNFIVQAKARIANATTENIFKSACGFVFKDEFSTHAVFFSLDGNANYRTDGSDRGSKYLDSTLFQNPDGVTLTLVLNKSALLFYVNDRLALSEITVYGGPFSAGPSILSGTSEGFGTRCDFTEMVMWEIE